MLTPIVTIDARFPPIIAVRIERLGCNSEHIIKTNDVVDAFVAALVAMKQISRGGPVDFRFLMPVGAGHAQ